MVERPRLNVMLFKILPKLLQGEHSSNPCWWLAALTAASFVVSICGNKMPTRCNRDFYCRSYCLLNMFRTPLCPSSGAQEYYTVVAACGISCCGFQVAGLVWSWGLCVRFSGCCSILQTGHITLSHEFVQYYIMRNLMTCTPRPLFLGDKIEKNEIGVACSAYGGEERRIQGFGGETWGKEATWETQT